MKVWIARERDIQEAFDNRIPNMQAPFVDVYCIVMLKKGFYIILLLLTKPKFFFPEGNAHILDFDFEMNISSH